MKSIQTRLSEKTFLSRLDSLCRQKTLFDKGYNDKDVFVIRKYKKTYCLCLHYAQVGRSDGYAMDCIFFRYELNCNGHVCVKYRIGKMISFLIPFVFCFAIGIAMWSALVFEAIVSKNVMWDGIIVATAFLMFGAINVLYRSKKQISLLEEHLFRICKIKQ